MVESIRKVERSVLLVDAGAVFDDTTTEKAEFMLNTMERMGYDALNLGGPELRFGEAFLAQTRSRVSFPYIASNLVSRGARLPWVKGYAIREAGGVKVAILGIVNAEDLAQLPDQEAVKDLRVLPPGDELKRLLAEAREKADLVILLSRFGAEETRAIVEGVEGVDVAVSSGGSEVYFTTAPKNNAVLAQTGSLGRAMGLLKLTRDEQGRFGVSERRYVSFKKDVPENEAIANLVEVFKKTGRKQTPTPLKQTPAELREGLKLSPGEFMERYRREGQGEKSQFP